MGEEQADGSGERKQEVGEEEGVDETKWLPRELEEKGFVRDSCLKDFWTQEVGGRGQGVAVGEVGEGGEGGVSAKSTAEKTSALGAAVWTGPSWASWVCWVWVWGKFVGRGRGGRCRRGRGQFGGRRGRTGWSNH